MDAPEQSVISASALPFTPRHSQHNTININWFCSSFVAAFCMRGRKSEIPYQKPVTQRYSTEHKARTIWQRQIKIRVAWRNTKWREKDGFGLHVVCAFWQTNYGRFRLCIRWGKSSRSVLYFVWWVLVHCAVRSAASSCRLRRLLSSVRSPSICCLYVI